MRVFKILFLCIAFAGVLHAQNIIANDSPIIGTWVMITPKNSPGPEFVPESYKGINSFTINSGQTESMADGTGRKYTHSVSFIAEWDGKKLTGQVTQSTWTETPEKLKVSVPFEYNSKQKRVIIHINNPEYGDVKFVYKKISK